jgi:hypothetical protein
MALDRRTKEVLLGFASFVVFSFSDACVKLIRDELPPYESAFFAALFGLTVLPFLLRKGDRVCVVLYGNLHDHNGLHPIWPTDRSLNAIMYFIVLGKGFRRATNHAQNVGRPSFWLIKNSFETYQVTVFPVLHKRLDGGAGLPDDDSNFPRWHASFCGE